MADHSTIPSDRSSEHDSSDEHASDALSLDSSGSGNSSPEVLPPDAQSPDVQPPVGQVPDVQSPDVQIDEGDLGYHKFTGNGRAAVHKSEMLSDSEEALDTGGTEEEKAEDLAFKEAVIAQATQDALRQKTELEEEKRIADENVAAVERSVRQDAKRSAALDELDALSATMESFDSHIKELTGLVTRDTVVLKDLNNQLALSRKTKLHQLEKKLWHQEIEFNGGLRFYQKMLKKTVKKNDTGYEEKNRAWHEERASFYEAAAEETEEQIAKTLKLISSTNSTIGQNKLSLEQYIQMKQESSTRYNQLLEKNSWYNELSSGRKLQKEKSDRITEIGKKIDTIRHDVMKSDILQYRAIGKESGTGVISLNGTNYFKKVTDGQVSVTKEAEGFEGTFDEADFNRQKEIQSIANQIRAREIFKYVNSDNLTEYMQYDENTGDFDFSEEAKQKTVLKDDLVDVNNQQLDGGGHISNLLGFFGSLGGFAGSSVMDFVNPYVQTLKGILPTFFDINSKDKTGEGSEGEAKKGPIAEFFSDFASKAGNVKLGDLPGFDYLFKLLAVLFAPDQNRGLLLERIPHIKDVDGSIKNLFANPVTDEFLTVTHNLGSHLAEIPKIKPLLSQLRELGKKITENPALVKELTELKDINAQKIIPLQNLTLSEIRQNISGSVVNGVKDRSGVQTDLEKNLVKTDLASYGSMVAPVLFSDSLIKHGVGKAITGHGPSPLFSNTLRLDPLSFLSSGITLGKSIYGIAQTSMEKKNQDLSKEAFAQRNMTRYSRLMQSAANESRVSRAEHITDIGTNLASNALKFAGVGGIGVSLGGVIIGTAIKKFIGSKLRGSNRDAIIKDSKVLGGIEYNKDIIPDDNFNEVFASVTGINSPDDMALSLQTIDAIDTHRTLRASLKNPTADTRDIDEAMNSLGFRNRSEYPNIRVRDILKKTTGETDYKTVIRNSIMVKGLDYNTIGTRFIKTFSTTHYADSKRKSRGQIADAMRAKAKK